MCRAGEFFLQEKQVGDRDIAEEHVPSITASARAVQLAQSPQGESRSRHKSLRGGSGFLPDNIRRCWRAPSSHSDLEDGAAKLLLADAQARAAVPVIEVSVVAVFRILDVAVSAARVAKTRKASDHTQSGFGADIGVTLVKGDGKSVGEGL